jgi:hypothetical protein
MQPTTPYRGDALPFDPYAVVLSPVLPTPAEQTSYFLNNNIEIISQSGTDKVLCPSLSTVLQFFSKLPNSKVSTALDPCGRLSIEIQIPVNLKQYAAHVDSFANHFFSSLAGEQYNEIRNGFQFIPEDNSEIRPEFNKLYSFCFKVASKTQTTALERFLAPQASICFVRFTIVPIESSYLDPILRTPIHLIANREFDCDSLNRAVKRFKKATADFRPSIIAQSQHEGLAFNINLYVDATKCSASVDGFAQIFFRTLTKWQNDVSFKHTFTIVSQANTALSNFQKTYRFLFKLSHRPDEKPQICDLHFSIIPIEDYDHSPIVKRLAEQASLNAINVVDTLGQRQVEEIQSNRT